MTMLIDTRVLAVRQATAIRPPGTGKPGLCSTPALDASTAC
jgi:hypothetical protein